MHYKEYLVSLINKHNIDPLVIMDTDELKVQCTRSEKDVINKRRKESTEQYRKRLIQVKLFNFLQKFKSVNIIYLIKMMSKFKVF